MGWVNKLIDKDRKFVGDVVKTTIQHECLVGILESGTTVKIIDIDDVRGYTIYDFEGHVISEIGWII